MIVDLNAFSIPEWSPEAPSPYLQSEAGVAVYNGLLEYYIKEKATGTYTHRYSKDKFKRNGFLGVYRNERKPYKRSTSKAILGQTSKAATGTYLPGTLRKWACTTPDQTTYYCGVTASAIMLMYYQEYRGSTITYVATADRSRNALCGKLVSTGCLINAGMQMDGIVNGGTEAGVKYTGLKKYFGTYIAQAVTAPSTASYSFNGIKSKIDSNKPVMVGTFDSHPQIKSNHALVVHGYCASVPQLIVNDGWGHNDVWINSGSLYFISSNYFD